MLTMEEVVSGLKKLNTTVVSNSTGVDYITVRNLKNGWTQRPAYSVIKRLSDYLESKDAK
jgi:hypothetical protein